jgi:hypothetical protein
MRSQETVNRDGDVNMVLAMEIWAGSMSRA